MADGPELVELTAYFPKRVFCFGRWQEGHMREGRGCRKDDVQQILTFAKTVQDAGGLFYLDGRKFMHVEVQPGTPRAYSIILRDGYCHPSELLRAAEAAARLIAQGDEVGQGAAGDRPTSSSAAGKPQKLYVPVTRKVSLTPETKDGKRAA